MAEHDGLKLHTLRAPTGAHKEPKRKGRGTGSGLGKTAGRGHKGQRSRTSGNVRPGFEGGQMPLVRRVPKRGFTNPARVVAQVVNIADLDRIAGDEITPVVLAAAGLVGKPGNPVKILGRGETARAYTIKGCTLSRAAQAKIERAGGRIEA